MDVAYKVYDEDVVTIIKEHRLEELKSWLIRNSKKANEKFHDNKVRQTLAFFAIEAGWQPGLVLLSKYCNLSKEHTVSLKYQGLYQRSISALHFACMFGNNDMIVCLLKLCEVTHPEIAKCVHILITNNHTPQAGMMLIALEESCLEALNMHLESFFCRAIESDNPAILDQLFRLLEVVKEAGLTPFCVGSLVKSYGNLIQADRKIYPVLLKHDLGWGKDFSELDDAKIRAIIKHRPDCINMTDSKGHSLLMSVVQRRSNPDETYQLYLSLMQKGANPNQKVSKPGSEYGWTVQDFAIQIPVNPGIWSDLLNRKFRTSAKGLFTIKSSFTELPAFSLHEYPKLKELINYVKKPILPSERYERLRTKVSTASTQKDHLLEKNLFNTLEFILERRAPCTGKFFSQSLQQEVLAAEKLLLVVCGYEPVTELFPHSQIYSGKLSNIYEIFLKTILPAYFTQYCNADNGDEKRMETLS